MTPRTRQGLKDLTLLFARFGIPLIVTSTDRTASHNREVGGVAGSLHLSGRAIDVVAHPSWARYEWAHPLIVYTARRQGASKALDEGDHVHIEFPT